MQRRANKASHFFVLYKLTNKIGNWQVEVGNAFCFFQKPDLEIWLFDTQVSLVSLTPTVGNNLPWEIKMISRCEPLPL